MSSDFLHRVLDSYNNNALQNSEGILQLRRLLAGNKRFVERKFSVKDYPTEIKEQAKDPQPYAIVLCCSDSRVPPEIIFDESIGKLFVIRVAGNVIDEAVLGSIEFGAKYFNLKLLVVLGHESCGIVIKTIDGIDVSPSIRKITEKILPAIETARRKYPQEDVLHYSIVNNVFYQIESCLSESSLIKKLNDNNELLIVGAIYDIYTGKVNLYEPHKQ